MRHWIGWAMAALAGGAASTMASPTPAPPANGLTVQMPAPVATFRQGPGVELVEAHCAMCHSADYLSNQPPFGRKFWRDTVDKMRKNYAAPVPEDKAEAIADYLVKAYGVEK